MDLHPGAHLDRFQILELLGQGGMGQVYRAFDPSLGREVALKLGLRQLSGTRLERFRREAEVAGKLVHPGIVRLHEAGFSQGQHYLVHELVAGARPLDHVFRESPLRRRVELVRDAARALGYAHQQGVIHRDVKPDNLLVDAAGALRVADFGLAAAEDQERLTRTGAWVGTPHYMAPEQVRADRGAQGPPTDVWALGVLLYQAIAGVLPFDGANVPALMGAISDSKPAALPPEAGALRAVCLRALAKTPEQRYPHAGALADELDRWLEGAAPEARRRLPLLAGALVGLGLLILAGALAWGTRAQPAPTPRVQASPSRPSAAREAAAAAAAQRRDWARIRAIGDAGERLAAGDAWVREHPDQALPAEDRELLLRLGRRYPLAAFELEQGQPARAAWDGEGLAVAGTGKLERRSLLGEAQGRVELPLGGETRGLCVLADGQVVVAGVGQLATAEAQPKTWSAGRGIGTLAASADGRWVAVGTNEQPRVTVLDAHTLRVVQALTGDHVDVTKLAFSADGRYLVAACGEEPDMAINSVGDVVVWDTRSWERAGAGGVTAYADAMALDPDGARVWLGTIAGQICAYDLPLDGGQLTLRQELARAEAVDASTDWREQSAHSGWVAELVLAPGGRLLYSLGAHESRAEWNDVIAWDLPSGEVRWRRELPAKACSLALSADGRYLVLGYAKGGVEVQRVELESGS